MNIDELCVNTIRMLSVDAIQKAGSGHPGLPMGAAAMAYVLWTKFMKHSPGNPLWPDRDRFVLSAGHGSAMLYSLLHLTGYEVTMDDLKQFRQWGSRTPGHPELGITPGVECTAGPLGQGFAMGVGLAMAERFLASRFNRDGYEIVNHFTYAIVSDGDLMEGVASEAASLAGHLKLGKLIYLFDNNRITLSGETKLMFTEDVIGRFEACGWHVEDVEDGNDLEAVKKALSLSREESHRPSLICVRTRIGYGSPNKQDTFGVHGSPLGAEEVAATKKNLGWPLEPQFHVPEEALENFGKAVPAGVEDELRWRALMKSYGEKYPDLAGLWSAAVEGALPDGWDKDIPEFGPDTKGIATRVAGGRIMNAIAAHVPFLVGGSGDLDPSTKTVLDGRGSFQCPGTGSESVQGAVSGAWGYGGANIAFGIREHAMAALCNGMALHGGVIPYGSTFLVFCDYMRPAIRLAALMGSRVIYLFTHDSVGVGEDGPTHQPVEQMASLRVIPNMVVIRPADANETAEAWKAAMKRLKGPVAIVLSRQKLPVLDRKKFAPAAGLQKGAYVLSDSGGKGPEIILIATGSEVHVALRASGELLSEGIPARVVSMPSWELFEKQPEEYRNQVLPPEVKKRICIEAGSSQGWHKYAGPEGVMVCIDRFGASAPGDEVLKRFGFTSENIVEKARSLLNRGS